MKYLLLVSLISLSLWQPVTAQESGQIIAEVIYATLTVYAVPSRGAPRVGELTQGDQLQVLQREEGYDGFWVRASSLSNGMTGWVDTSYLYFQDASWKSAIPVLNQFEIQNPAYVENDTLPLPLESQTSFCIGSPIRLRAAPWRNSETIARLLPETKVIITGNAVINGAYAPFVRVLHPESGAEGWAYADCIGNFYESIINWMNVNLPVFIYDEVTHATENPISEIQTTTRRNSYLRLYPESTYARPHVAYLPVGTSLRLIGRTECDVHRYCWFQAEHQGKVGWIWGRNVYVADGWEGLPILKMY